MNLECKKNIRLKSVYLYAEDSIQTKQSADFRGWVDGHVHCTLDGIWYGHQTGIFTGLMINS